MLPHFSEHERAPPLRVAESQRLRAARAEGALDLDALSPSGLFVRHAGPDLLACAGTTPSRNWLRTFARRVDSRTATSTPAPPPDQVQVHFLRRVTDRGRRGPTSRPAWKPSSRASILGVLWSACISRRSWPRLGRKHRCRDRETALTRREARIASMASDDALRRRRRK